MTVGSKVHRNCSKLLPLCGWEQEGCYSEGPASPVSLCLVDPLWTTLGWN